MFRITNDTEQGKTFLIVLLEGSNEDDSGEYDNGLERVAQSMVPEALVHNARFASPAKSLDDTSLVIMDGLESKLLMGQ